MRTRAERWAVTLPPELEARMPKVVEVNGTTEQDDVTHADALRFYCSLPLKELRQRQALCREQQGYAYEQRNERAAARLSVTEQLLTEAVGYTSFDDWPT